MTSVIMTSRCLLLINIDWHKHLLCLWSSSKSSMLYFFKSWYYHPILETSKNMDSWAYCMYVCYFLHGIFQSRQVEGITSFLHPALHLCLSCLCQDNRLRESKGLPLATQSNGNQHENLRYESTFLGENDNGALLHRYPDILLNVFVSQRNNMISLRWCSRVI